jgi:hypothetical protein
MIRRSSAMGRTGQLLVTEIRRFSGEPKVYLQGSNPVKLGLFTNYFCFSVIYSIFLAV